MTPDDALVLLRAAESALLAGDTPTALRFVRSVQTRLLVAQERLDRERAEDNEWVDPHVFTA